MCLPARVSKYLYYTVCTHLNLWVGGVSEMLVHWWFGIFRVSGRTPLLGEGVGESSFFKGGGGGGGGGGGVIK